MPVFNNALAGAAGSGGAAAGPIKSVRFNRDDTPYLNKTFSSDGNRRKFTYSFWVKRTNVGLSENVVLVEARVTGTPSVDSDAFSFRFDTSDRIRVADWGNFYVTSTSRFRDPSAWYHLVLSVDTTQASNNISVYVNGVLDKQGTYPQNTDTRVSAGTGTVHEIGTRTYGYPGDNYYLNAYLADFYFIDGQALDPTSFGEFDDNGVWQAAAYSGGSYGTNGFHLFDFANESGIGDDSSGNDNDWTVNNLVGSLPDISADDVTVYRDNAVYAAGNPEHLFDSNKSTYSYAGSNNATNYVDWSPTVGYETSGHIWIQGGNGNGGGCDSMTVTINGSTVTRSAVVDNETYTNASYGWGDWHKYTVSGNTLNSLRVTGAYALIRQLSTVADPTHATLGISDDNNVPVIEIVDPANLDVLRDVPTNGTQSDTGAGGEVSGNYCTWNPLAEQKSGSITLSNGNLTATVGSTRSSFFGTMALEGKTYWEIVFTGGAYTFGMADASMFNTTANTAPNRFIGETSTSWGIGNDGTVYNNGASQGTETSWTNGDVMGWSYDSSNGAIKIYKNGTLNGSYTASTANTYFPAATLLTSGASVDVNFGQRAFAYSAPSGYKALCTTNLDDPLIADGSTAFDGITYNGATQSPRTITGLSFEPDLVWVKNRSISAGHYLWDAVRGTDNNLRSDGTFDESSVSGATNGIISTNASNGFVVKNGSGSGSNVGSSGSNAYVAWTWDAGSSNTSISVGGLNSSVYDQSQNWSSGTYTGTAGNSGYQVTEAFNGVGAEGDAFGSGKLWGFAGGSATLTLPAAITLTSSSTLELISYQSSQSGGNITFTCSNGSVAPTLTVNAVNVLGKTTISDPYTTFGASITAITINASGTDWTALSAIKVDGKLLVDSGVSVTNVPSIASTVRANPSAGFSIVSYTGNLQSNTTVGHGLNAEPYFIIVKERDSTTQNWNVYHKITGNTKALFLNLTNASTTSSAWSNTTPTSSVFTVGAQNGSNGNGKNIIAYCFAPVEGYSAIGSYTGNGSADGPFVYTGFRPAFLLFRATDSTHWVIYDSTRNTYNGVDLQLAANLSNIDSDENRPVDFLSNGFKIRFSGYLNDNNDAIIYYAVAETPFKTARAR